MLLKVETIFCTKIQVEGYIL